MYHILKEASITNIAFAKTPCVVGIRTVEGVIGPVEKGKTIPVAISAGLSCPEGTAKSGATLTISGDGHSKSVTTDFRGLSEATFNLGPSSNPYGFKANFAGDSEHDAASATTGFFIDEK